MLFLIQSLIYVYEIDNVANYRSNSNIVPNAEHGSINRTSIKDITRQANNKPSIDAIAVWSVKQTETSEDYEIWYSMYGHTPSFPSRKQPINWVWWNGTDINTASSPLYTTGKNSEPDVAYGRTGNIFVAWSYTSLAGGIYEIKYAIWYQDMGVWDIGTLARHDVSTPKVLTGLSSPTIAVDVNGYAIAVWCANWEYSTGSLYLSGTDLYYSYWNGTAWSKPQVLYDAPIGDTNEEYYGVSSPSIAFIATLAPANSKTIHKAILCWSYYHSEPETSTYLGKVQYSVWGGDSFDVIGDVDLSEASTYIGTVEVSSDKNGKAYAVWGCETSTYISKWNGSAWTTNQSCIHSDDIVDVGIAFNHDNDGIIIHDVFSDYIYYKEVKEGVNTACNPAFNGSNPTIAYMPHDRFISCWVTGENSIGFSTYNGTLWKDPDVIPNSSGFWIFSVSLSAKTGSPSLPLAEWTLLTYECGDNDLYQEINATLNAMASSGSTATVNIISLYDVYSPLDGGVLIDMSTMLYYVARSNPVERVVDGWVPDELDLFDGDNLDLFIRFTVEEYPANHYILILDDHGFGWLGAMEEYNIRGGRWAPKGVMSLIDMANAFRTAGLDQEQFDIIGSTGCLMSMIEVAYELREFADYLILTEEVGYAWNFFSDLTARIVSNPLISPVDLAQSIVGDYRDFIDGVSTFHPETLAAINLSVIEDLVSSVDNLSQLLLNNLGLYQAEIVSARRAAQPMYYWERGSHMMIPEFIDLYSFVRNIRDRIDNTDIDGVANVIINILENRLYLDFWADTTMGVGEIWRGSDFHGLSIYFEQSTMGYNDNYDMLAFSIDTHWDEFMKAYCTVVGASIVLIKLVADIWVDLHVFTMDGRHVGRNCSLRYPIERGIENSSYISDMPNGTTIIYFPIVLRQFNWTVDGLVIMGADNTSFRLNISVVREGKVVYSEKIIGTIKSNETLSGIFVIPPDTMPPQIHWVSRDPENPKVGEIVNITANITDNTSVATAILSYNNGSGWINTTMEYNTATLLYQASIPPQQENTTVSYKIYASDPYGNWIQSTTYTYQVQPKAEQTTTPPTTIETSEETTTIGKANYLWIPIIIAIILIIVIVAIRKRGQ